MGRHQRRALAAPPTQFLPPHPNAAPSLFVLLPDREPNRTVLMADWERAFKELLAVRGASLRAYAYLLTSGVATGRQAPGCRWAPT